MLSATPSAKMTKEHALNSYKHFRDLENNYIAREGLNSGPTATARVRARAKRSADNILIRHPDFEEKPSTPEPAKETKSKEKK